MKIAVDFDGTCVSHEYPKIGKDIGAVPVLKKFVAAGHLLILNTMRSGKELQEAVDWFKENGIALYGVNEDPGQREWTQSPKVFANLYIDDAALGCPLIYPVKGALPPDDHVCGRPYVDWEAVERLFFDGIMNPCPCPDIVSKDKEYQYSSIPETQKHADKVLCFIHIMTDELSKRALFHDKSKMESPEVELFDEYTPKLAGSTYGSDEYKQFLIAMKPALEHHYTENRHHPEHFENGMRGMNLIDLIEMFCDWYAATKRHDNGDIMRSIILNQERFGYSDDIKAVLENTYKDVFEE